jgi:tetratricopeptide (TPR) repeat protein
MPKQIAPATPDVLLALSAAKEESVRRRTRDLLAPPLNGGAAPVNPLFTGGSYAAINPQPMFPRLLLIAQIALAVFFTVNRVFAAENEPRGWGSAWIIPHSAEEKIARERSDRLDKAVKAEDWATVATILEELERSDSKSWELQSIEGYVATLRRRYSEAVDHYDRALTLLPESSRLGRSKLLVDRATAHALSGSYRAARTDLEKAIALDKDNILAHNNYAWLLATCPDDSVRDGRRAVQYARGASEIMNHGSSMVLDTLAAAEAEIGDFRSAVKHEKRALSLAKGDRTIYTQHLQSYMNANPVHEAPEPPKSRGPLKKS